MDDVNLEAPCNLMGLQCFRSCHLFVHTLDARRMCFAHVSVKAGEQSRPLAPDLIDGTTVCTLLGSKLFKTPIVRSADTPPLLGSSRSSYETL